MTRRSLFKSAALVALGAAVGSRTFKALVEAAPDDPGAAAKRLASEAVVIGQDIALGVCTTISMKYDKAKDTWTMLDVVHDSVKGFIDHEELREVVSEGRPGNGHAWDRVAKKTGASLEEVRRVAAEVLEGTVAVRAKEGYCATHGGHVPEHEGFLIAGPSSRGPLLCINCGEVIGPCENGHPDPEHVREKT